jgi:hypothetical protein
MDVISTQLSGLINHESANVTGNKAKLLSGNEAAGLISKGEGSAQSMHAPFSHSV